MTVALGSGLGVGEQATRAKRSKVPRESREKRRIRGKVGEISDAVKPFF
jgi:hypothetical protein